MNYQIQHFMPLIEDALQKLPVPEQPASLYDPVRYFMQLPGKRIRPVFVLQVLELFRKPAPNDAAVALCTELFHNFSLVHDDIMDKADMRRGFPTLHVKWDEPTAILAGDALLVLAYDALLSGGNQTPASLIKSFNQMALGVCEGQQLDMDFSTLSRVSMPEYLDMIDRKTAVLIGFSFALGAHLGNAGEREQTLLYRFGLAMGRCFQLRDDYLDLFGNESITGKKRGGDIGNFKLSYPVLASMEHADAAGFLKRWQDGKSDSGERIASVLDWMENAGIREITENYLQQETEAGIDILEKMEVNNPEAAMRLKELCKALAFREK